MLKCDVGAQAVGGLCYNSLAASCENIVPLPWGGGRLELRPDVSRSASESGAGRMLPSALCKDEVPAEGALEGWGWAESHQCSQDMVLGS